LFFALITIDPVLNQPNLTAAFRYILRAFVTLIIAIPVLLFFGAVADALWVGGNAFKIATARLLQDGPLSLCFDIGKYVIYSVLVIYVPLVLLALLRFPISWASGAAWWLATHPKGAWTAMLLALTTALSLLKIMF